MDNGVEWKNTQDHSKYCLAELDNHDVVCMGDMNRMNSQRKRGGGMMCIDDSEVWTAVNKAIEDWENCPDGYNAEATGTAKWLNDLLGEDGLTCESCIIY